MQKVNIGHLNLLKILLAVSIAAIVILVTVADTSAAVRYGSGNQKRRKRPTPTVTPRAPRCGNNQCDPGETCDGAVYCVVGGGAIFARDCRNNNQTARCTFCGDGVLQENAGEQCDDGDYNDSDSCSNSCKKQEVKGTTTPKPTLVRTGISLVVPSSLGLISLAALFAINKKKAN